MNRISTRSNSPFFHDAVEESPRGKARKKTRIHKQAVQSFTVDNQAPPSDISDGKQAENALRENEQFQGSILNSIPDPAWMKSSEGIFKAVNQAWCAFAGRDAASVIGKTAGELFSPEIAEKFHQVDSTVLKTKEPLRLEEHLSHDPEKAWFDTVITPLLDEQGEVQALIGIARDITQRKLMDEHFLRNQRLETIGSLAGGIAHDLNNVLGPVLMSASMLGCENLPPETFRELIAIIQEAAQRGVDIVSQLLTFARGSQGECRVLDPRILISQVERIFKETLPKTIHFDVSLPEKLWNVMGDLTQLHRVFVNLCVNARDAMPEGGTLSLSAKNFKVCKKFASKIPSAKTGRYVRINVTDTGIGIPREILAKIFDPFFTTKASGKGTGLGLSTVLGIVKSHGGFVTIASKIRKGSTFSIYLPSTTENPKPAKPQDDSPVPPGKGEVILVVDDEASICKMARTILTSTGYKIITASDGKEALDLFKKHDGAIHAVLTDLAMPAMDGVALTRALRELSPSLPVIASTGQSAELRYKEMRHLNVRSFLSKPYSAQQLLAVVHHALYNTPDLAA